MGDDPVPPDLARRRQHGSVGSLHAVGRIGMRAEREQRGVEIRLPQTAVGHAPAPELDRLLRPSPQPGFGCQ